MKASEPGRASQVGERSDPLRSNLTTADSAPTQSGAEPSRYV
jgi:hypothetical protein